tara:strand:- start:279 stop:1049 length:771 start_codon:yes stop_codon:yes gene_type:complete
MSAISKYLKHDLIAKDFTYSEWYHYKDVSKAASQFESVVYFIVYNKDKPTMPPNKLTDRPFIKIGTSSGKGFGMSDDSMSGKHRTNRRKGTTQPQDRWGDHKVILQLGWEANQIKKNIGNLRGAWAPVFEKYGYGPKLTRNIWVSFLIPNESMNFRDSSMLCEWMEINSINDHIHKFQGSAPDADLKYQSMSDKERRGLCMEKERAFKARNTRFANDEDYIDRFTNNSKNFRDKPADLTVFLTKNPKKLKKVSYER